MQQAAIEKLRTLRTWRSHLAMHGERIACDCELQPGRFRKTQRIGGLCHFGKLSGQLTARDLRRVAKEREGLKEVLQI